MKSTNFRFVSAAGLAFCACAILAPAFSLRAQEAEEAAPADPALAEEIAFAEALNAELLPDLAASVIADARKKWPKEEAQWSRLEVEILIMKGDFKAVEKLVAAAKSKGPAVYWAMNLELARGYYSYSRREDCKKIYDAFFGEIKGDPPAQLREFFVKAAQTYVVILKDEPKKAVEVYKRLYPLLTKLSAGSGFDKWGENRAVTAQQYAQLLLKLASEEKPGKARNAYLDLARPVVKEMLYMSDSYVFGPAIAMRAHIELLGAGDGKSGEGMAKAQRIIEDYMPKLRKDHDELRAGDPDNANGTLAFSALPQCRYMLAKMLWSEVESEMKKPKPNDARILDLILGEKVPNGKGRSGNGAFNHALNVFLKHPESLWATDSEKLCRTIQAFVLERFKKELSYKATPQQLARARQTQFRRADTLFAANNFAEAEPAYRKVLERFPEVPESPRAMSNLARCIIENASGMPRSAEKRVVALFEVQAIALQLVERFCSPGGDGSGPAGDFALSIAGRLSDMKEKEAAKTIYKMYLDTCPQHPLYASMALSLGFEACDAADKLHEAAAGDEAKAAEAARLYRDAVEYLRHVPARAHHGNDAMLRMAQAQIKLNDDFAAKTTLAAMIDTFKDDPQTRVNALLQKATLQKQEGVALLQTTEESAARFRAAAAESLAAAAATLDKADTNELAAVVASAGAADDKALADAMLQRGSRTLLQAIKDLNGLAAESKTIAEGTRATPDDKRRAGTSREFALFQIGDTWQRLTHPAAKVPEFRRRAAQAFEAYVAEYPKGINAASAYFRISTIYSTLPDEPGAAEKAGKALSDLQANFPDSELARNSIPMLARTYLDMNLPDKAVEQYRLMLRTKGKYNERDYMDAGDALIAKGQYEVAREAYRAAIDLAKNGKYADYYVPKCRFGVAKAFAGAKNWVEATETISDFLEQEEKKKQEARSAGKKVTESPLVKEGLVLLSEIAVKAGKSERDDAARKERFNAAASALKKLMLRYPLESLDRLVAYKNLAATEVDGLSAEDRAKVEDAAAKVAHHWRNKVERDRIILRIAGILVEKMESEREMGRSEEAAATLQQVAMSYAGYLNENIPDGVLTPIEEAQGITSERKIALVLKEKRSVDGEMENLERCIAAAMPHLIAAGGPKNLELAVKSGRFYAEQFATGRDADKIKAETQRAASLLEGVAAEPGS